MADQCGPWVVDTLDIFGKLDNLLLTVDDPAWVSADTCVFDVPLSVETASAVNADGNAILENIPNVTSDVTVVSGAIRVRTAEGLISSSAEVLTDYLRIRDTVSQVSVQGFVGFDYSRVRDSNSLINVSSFVFADPSRVKLFEGFFDANTSVVSDAIRVRLGIGNVTSSVVFDTDYIRVKSFDADVNISSTVVADGSYIPIATPSFFSSSEVSVEYENIIDASAFVSSFAFSDILVNIVADGFADVLVVADPILNGERMGDKWIDIEQGIESWTGEGSRLIQTPLDQLFVRVDFTDYFVDISEGENLEGLPDISVDNWETIEIGTESWRV